jgi:uroporphyrinogen-III synthase
MTDDPSHEPGDGTASQESSPNDDGSGAADDAAPAVDPESSRLTVAVFRPDDERASEAAELIEALGADPVLDPMLEVDPTGLSPREDADYVVLTSKTGVELAADAGWDPGAATVCAIGDRTAEALRAASYSVDVVPEQFSSAGLVGALRTEVDGARVELARSDHGSQVLTDGLEAAGAYVHETVLYELVRPDGAGDSTELAADGDLDAVLFTSSLTVENFLATARERGLEDRVKKALLEATVGAIGHPTRTTAEEAGITVDVVPDEADFEALATEAVEAAAPTYHD